MTTEETTIPYFRTDRLQLRLVQLADWPLVHALNSLPETNVFNPSGIPESTAQTQQLVAQWVAAHQQPIPSGYTFLIEKLATADFVGLIALNRGKPRYNSAEVWYKIHRNYWKNGFATEALNRLLHFGFTDLHLHRIEAGCAVGNTGSIRVLEKVGMLKEGRRRQLLPLATGWSDNFEFAALAADFT